MNRSLFLPIYGSFLVLFAFVCFFSCKNDPTSLSPEDQHLADFRPPAGKWGFINTSGRMQIPYTYDGVRDFSEGLCAINLGGKWTYINSKNDLIAPPQFKAAWPHHSAKARVKFMDNQFGWVDHLGNVLDTLSEFDHVYQEKNGFSKVKKNNKYGLINKTGILVIPCDYTSIRATDYNYLIAKNYLGSTVINYQGIKLIPNIFEEIITVSKDEIYVKNKANYAIINLKTGRNKTIKYNIDQPFNHGVTIYEIDDQYGLVNSKGEVLVQAQYEDLIYAGEHKWMTNQNRKFGLIDAKGNTLVSPKYDLMHVFSQGLAAVRQDELWGFIDTTGFEIIPPQFALVWDFSQGWAQVVGEHQLGFISKSGDYLASTGYYESRSFSDGLCAVQEWVQ